MSRRRHRLFPDGLSDETAVALCDFLFQLATACESHYLVQLRRHFDRQRNSVRSRRTLALPEHRSPIPIGPLSHPDAGPTPPDYSVGLSSCLTPE
jgi:hypothetical protein